jgi:hypothetical protein
VLFAPAEDAFDHRPQRLWFDAVPLKSGPVRALVGHGLADET